MRVFLLLALVAFAPAAAAQVPAPPPAPAPVVSDTGTVAALRLADAYLAAGQPERAVPLLEDLLAARPADYPLFAKLRDAYLAAGQMDAVVPLVERRLAVVGPQAPLLADLGAALFGAGRSEEATEAWARAIAAAPDAEMTYRVVAESQGSQGLFEEAIATLEAGRARLPAVGFHAERANVYTLAGQTEQAGDAWFAFLEAHPEAQSLVQNRLTRLLEGLAPVGPSGAHALEGGPIGGPADPAPALAAAADRAVRRAPLVRAVRETAGWLAMQRGDWGAGLDAHIAVDRLEGEEGQPLVLFGEAAAAAGALDEAERAFTLVLERHPEGPAAGGAALGLADVEARRSAAAGERIGTDAPLARSAVARYNAFAEERPGDPRTTIALHHAALLTRDVLGDEAEAERLLGAAAARPGLAGDEAATVRLELGRSALRRDDLAAARVHFAAVEESARIGAEAEVARLELAYLDFYAGETTSALTRAQAMDRNTATDVANDALLLRLLLTENVGQDSVAVPLQMYARAALRLRQGRAALSVATLDTLLALGNEPVADDAAFLRALALRADGRTNEAVMALEAYPNRYPESFLVERARFYRAEVLERDVRDPVAARSAYDDFLVRHPRSVLAPEARARLQALSGPG
ncbi:MAG TPA: tetratricopeptide repeat protein [Rhodothermales bacterium]|nr:tetratricopeptide repeat protein [Rhodothermales bacterium]